MKQLQAPQDKTIATTHRQPMDSDRLFFAIGGVILLAALLGLGLERLLIP